jgi:thioredoxin reductase (NADPH)
MDKRYHWCTAKQLLFLQELRKYLGSSNITQMGGGVSACAVAMVFYRNQVVIGKTGDSACEEAHYLSKLCK